MGRIRTWSRFLRWGILTLAGGIGVLLIWVIWVGEFSIPAFLQRRLVSAAAAQGWVLSADQMRWKIGSGLEFEQLRLQPKQQPLLSLKAQRALLEASLWSLIRQGIGAVHQIQVEELQLTELTSFPHLQAWAPRLQRLRLGWPSSNRIELQTAELQLGKLHLSVSGLLQNPALLWSRKSSTPKPFSLQQWLQRIDHFLAQWKIKAEGAIQATIRGDARKLDQLRLQARARFQTLRWRDGSVQALQLEGSCFPARFSRWIQGDLSAWENLSVQLQEVNIRDWKARKVQLKQIPSPETSSKTMGLCLTAAEFYGPHSLHWQNLHLELRPSHPPASRWALAWSVATGTVEQIHWQGAKGKVQIPWPISRNVLFPLTGTAQWIGLQIPGYQVEEIGVQGKIAFNPHPPKLPPAFQSAFGSRLAPLQFSGTFQAKGLRVRQTQIPMVSAVVHWDGSRLEWTNLYVRFQEGEFLAPTGLVDLRKGWGTAKVETAFVPDQIVPFLPPKAADWLLQFGTETPPHGWCQVQLTLPIQQPYSDWQAEELLRRLRLQARIVGDEITYRGVRFEHVDVQLGISNLVLHLQPLRIVRPEGEATIRYKVSLQEPRFHWWIEQGRLDPYAMAPVIYRPMIPILRLFQFLDPVEVQGEVWGRYHDEQATGFDLHLRVGRMKFRDVLFQQAQGQLSYRPGELTSFQPFIQWDSESVQADQVIIRIPQKTVQLIQARGKVIPQHVIHLLDPKLERILQSIQFEGLADTVANGTICWTNLETADLHIRLIGGPMRWWRLRLTEVEATMRFHTNALQIEPIDIRAYDGLARAKIRLAPLQGQKPFLQTTFVCTNLNLRLLTQDIAGTKKNVAGRLSGWWAIEKGTLDDPQSWIGQGAVHIEDGLLWDIPLFGVLSPVLDMILPGLGRNRATALLATFNLHDGWIETDDMTIHAGPARIQYRGRIGLDGSLQAHGMVEILRGAPLVGPLFGLIFSPVTKAFEFRVQGTLQKPHLELLYVPSFLHRTLSPLHWIHKVIQPGGSKSPSPSSSSSKRTKSP